MSVDNAEKSGGLLRGQLRTDAGLQWLVDHGPVIQDPPLEPWLLRQLVATKRIVRLRRGAYLAPHAEGVLPPVEVAAALLAPEGYVSFYGALTLHGLTDQTAGTWAVVTRDRQRPARYADLTIEFIAWPKRLPNADVRVHRVRGAKVRVATPVQAFCDALEAPRLAPPPAEMLRILRFGLATSRMTVTALRAYSKRINSSFLAARLGFLLEAASGEVDQALLKIARQSHAWRSLTAAGGHVADSTWRLMTPTTKEQLIRSST